MASRRMILSSLLHDEGDILVSRGTALSADGKERTEVVHVTLQGKFGDSNSILLSTDEVDEFLKMLVGCQQDAIKVNNGEQPYMS